MSEELQEVVQGGNVAEQLIAQPSQLNTLADRLRGLFRLNTSRMEVLEQAIKALRIGLSMHPPDADRFAYVNDLAGALWERYQRNGNLADLNEPIEILGDVLTRCPLGHPLRAETLNNLAICLHDRYREKHSLSDLDEAIKTHEAALALRIEGHPDRSSSLTNLGLCLRDRSKENSTIDDLDRAIACSRDALALRPAGHPLRPSCLSNLAIALQYRYELRNALEDLQESIQFLRIALACYPPGHHECPTVQYNLCVSLRYKFRWDGTIADLNEAIDLLQPLSQHRSFHHATSLLYINFSASCLMERFTHLGSPMDLDNAILLHNVTVAASTHDHSERSTFLNNLGGSFQQRFVFCGQPKDLEKAIGYHRDALDLRPPGHSERSSSLNNLALCFKQRFKSLNEFEDLTKAIEFSRAGLDLRPEGHVQRSRSLEQLAECLMLRSKTYGAALSDLTTAIDLFRATLSLRPAGHHERSQTLSFLAHSLLRSFENSQVTDDIDEAFQLYSELSEPKEIVFRPDFRAAVGWAESADKFSHSSAMTAYQTALTFLVRLAAIFPSSVEHYQTLKGTVSSLAVDAFSYCVRKGNIKTAIELLEQGRTVFWAQLARLGTPLDELSSLGDETANLADEFRRVSSRLRILFDHASEFQSAQTRKLIKELDDVTSRIRTVPSFSRFLLPPNFSDLQTTSKGGPVIIMNASWYSCDAVIILHDNDPVRVPLKTSKTHLSTLATRFRRVVDKPKLVTVKEIGIILREIWECAVEPVVQALQDRGVATDSRIWWCPTSDFTFLPLHASGPYRKGKPNLIDLYISSYTPTLGTLLRARKQSNILDNPSFAVVGASEPLGEAPLPSVTAELSLVAERVRDHSQLALLANKDATIERAAEAFKRCKWLHLACHGIPDKMQPFESSFALHDGHLTLKRLVQGEFENPDFAFAMQFGGFRSVIGTVLPVDDTVAGRVVTAFYANMLEGTSGRLDSSKAAVALHKSLKELRGKIPFDQQIVFIHLGV